VTARQIIEEFKSLPREEQAEVWTQLKQQIEVFAEKLPSADHDEAMKIADRVFSDRERLFRRLAE
jgi:hypothetical protein